jgi:hypothetical protein
MSVCLPDALSCARHNLLPAAQCGDNEGNLTYEAGPYIMFSHVGIYHFLSHWQFMLRLAAG